MARFPKKTAYVACNGERTLPWLYLRLYGRAVPPVWKHAKKDAIFYNELGVAEIDEEKCIGCGLC